MSIKTPLSYFFALTILIPSHLNEFDRASKYQLQGASFSPVILANATEKCAENENSIHCP